MLEALVGVMIVGGAVALFWSHLRSPAPAVAHLEISADDEEMIAARDRARQSVGEFMRLYSEHPEGAMIKVPFVSSANVTEFKRRREMHGALPPELQAEEQSYDWEGS